MIWFIAPAIAGLVFTARWVFKEFKDSFVPMPGFALVMGLSGTAMAIAIVGLLGNLLGAWLVGSHAEKYADYELINISDQSGIRGSFFLGSGSIDGQPVFYYYEKTENGIRLNHKYGTNALITESDETPRVMYYKDVSNNKFWFIGGLTEWTTSFSIPKGSIITDYTLGE